MKAIDLEILAVMFRTNDPNLGHVSTLDTMLEAGLGYPYGLYRAIPFAHWRKRKAARYELAAQLDAKAKAMAQS